MSSAPATALSVAPAFDIIVELKSAFAEYESVEKKGLAFGQRLYELRAESEVVQGGTSFTKALKGAGIPRRTAYHWIHSYEISVGKSKPKLKKPAGAGPSDYDRGFSDGHAEALHKVAALRFKADSSKCYQRHIREVYAEIDGREQMQSLDDAAVVSVTNEEASTLIRKYEWLQTMGAGTIACYGLKIDGELLGVACFGKGGSTEARDIVEGREDQTICLMRGACVPWAPDNAGSFLVRHACRLASKEHGWTVFFAYSDPEAGEIGTVYQACGWEYISTKPSGGKHLRFTKGDDTISSYQFNHRFDNKFAALGWDGVQPKYDFLRQNGWIEAEELRKKKYIWLEGEKDAAGVLQANGWEIVPYPKRAGAQ